MHVIYYLFSSRAAESTLYDAKLESGEEVSARVHGADFPRRSALARALNNNNCDYATNGTITATAVAERLLRPPGLIR